MKPKKVVFFIDSLGGGGAERVVTSLCSRLGVYGKSLSGTVIFGDFAPDMHEQIFENL